MKKKAIFITCTVVALLAIAAMIVFVFSGKDSDVPEQKVPDLSGAWEVAAMFQNGAPTFVDGQYMTFSDGRAKYYNGNETPSAESSYSIDVDTLKLPEIAESIRSLSTPKTTFDFMNPTKSGWSSSDTRATT